MTRLVSSINTEGAGAAGGRWGPRCGVLGVLGGNWGALGAARAAGKLGPLGAAGKHWVAAGGLLGDGDLKGD